jgi:signal transduction protein with GAF and PtsI domain
MGWRSIRVGLDRPGMLRQQLRAMIRAAAGRELSVMFPMIAEVAEFEAAKHLLDIELARARARGAALPGRLRIGAMMEVPGLMWQLDALLPLVDFLSVGSNDLFQFMFASDRGNPRVADRYDNSPSTIWRWATEDRFAHLNFPKPIKLGPNTTAWDDDELDAYDAERRALTDEPEGAIK